MFQQITEGISISVEVFFNSQDSNPVLGLYAFAYKVSIENFANFPVQLLRRHWYIFESNGGFREVEGEGVVGQQPVLEPGEHFEYISGCSIKTDIGKMRGTYQMVNLMNRKLFTVNIPEFQLVAPFKNN
ncbi:MAG: Co2+/Mg2+ efflux protein ApaG [Chitinophagaceae bacterium]